MIYDFFLDINISLGLSGKWKAGVFVIFFYDSIIN